MKLCLAASVVAAVQLRGQPAYELPSASQLSNEVQGNLRSFITEDVQLGETMKDAEGAAEQTVDQLRIRLQAELSSISDENARLEQQATFAEKEVQELSNENEALSKKQSSLQIDNARLAGVLQTMKQKLLAKMGNLDATLATASTGWNTEQRQQAPAEPQMPNLSQATEGFGQFGMGQGAGMSMGVPQMQGFQGDQSQEQMQQQMPPMPQMQQPQQQMEQMPPMPQAAMQQMAPPSPPQPQPVHQQSSNDMVTVSDFLGDAPPQKTISVPNDAVAPASNTASQQQPPAPEADSQSMAEDQMQPVQTSFLQTHTAETARNGTMTSLIAARRLLRDMANRVDRLAFQSQQVAQTLQSMYTQARARKMAERQAIGSKMRELAQRKAAGLQQEAQLKTSVARLEAINAALRSQMQSFDHFIGSTEQDIQHSGA
mmetsp:Transcript_50322/g.110059  ORF Transcript_50322/g.110059 Transcript_50322/m.110059 type:complete len:430 (-) Transcript_50322:95-1384(-)|eukprot:CAMPEP_0204373010 /NCGR_PEP_ID=MMETSP0469-20131031/47712_1 /ASSEMBLY_ACC=CAM_ASM_000384 /TAXON_ID=2969 /ORGANISM="Oxyrrhis marina" /LENGTH=429 /DNA_ID=CAMNT_0051363393 /DNA_START=27 /DNA_END=1316 /DNA_ORIENTATION=-